MKKEVFMKIARVLHDAAYNCERIARNNVYDAVTECMNDNAEVTFTPDEKGVTVTVYKVANGQAKHGTGRIKKGYAYYSGSLAATVRRALDDMRES